MICKDMKYVALYWALRFYESELDVHVKQYDDHEIKIFAEEQRVDYGDKIKAGYSGLLRHKDFVVLECVDRLLSLGYSPENISLYYKDVDILVNLDNGELLAIRCEQWGEDYQRLTKLFNKGTYTYNVLYTSRLVSGLLEYKNIIIADDIYQHGIFDSNEKANFHLSKEYKPVIEHNNDYIDFDIYEGEVVRYKGKEQIVHVPNGIRSIAASAFWNNNYIEEVVLPESLESLGGDAFYYCNNLERVIIPQNVKIMGNNPFAGCPKLKLGNESPNYIIEKDVLYDENKELIIYYPISKTEKEFKIPESVTCIGKHCFFNCNNLTRIKIPKSVVKMENNPFSGCEQLQIDNESLYYIFDKGIIYNKYMTTIIGCLNGTILDEYVVPESVTLISRNSFWNCKGIRKIKITKNVKIIGYNPFANCYNLKLTGVNDNFKIENGIIYSNDFSNLSCATDISVGEQFKLKDEVRVINRGAFSGCIRLNSIDFNKVTYIDKSAFTNCISLKQIYIPDNVEYVGEWAFAYCRNLEKVSINRKTIIDNNAFNECPAKIEWR